MHWLLPWWTYPAAYCFLTGAACGWPVGYVHRGLIEWGRKYGRLLAWRRQHRGRGPLRRLARWIALADLPGDIVHLWTTGELRPGR